MTTPCSGQISFSDINLELDRPRNTRLDFDDDLFRILIKNTVKRSQVKISDAYCRKGVDPGQAVFYSTQNWQVQNYINMTVEMWAGGGGGGGGHANDGFAYGYNGSAGGAGGDSAVLGAGAGGGGAGGPGYGGGAGGGYNGDVRVGGGAPGGGPGGQDAGAGGAGGYCVRRWNRQDPGAPAWGAVITVYVGGGGAGGIGGNDSGRYGGTGGAGGNGQVVITWGY